MSGASKGDLDAIRDDPAVKEAMSRVRLAIEAAERATAEVMRRRGVEGYTPKCDPANLTFRRNDPNPWLGKEKVPAMLVRMGCEGRGLGLRSNRARHEELIAEACKRCGATKESDTRSPSVWTNKLTGFSLTNCRRHMEAAGYKVPRAVDTVAKFFEIIEAGKQVSSEPAERVGCRHGEGIHAVTFFSANDMLYRGERFNLQWAKAGKKCDPINGSATVSGALDGKPVRGGLRALLIRLKSITADEWRTVKQAAQQAEERARVRAAMPAIRAAQQARRHELEEAGLFEADKPTRNVRSEDEEHD